ncbi:MAG: hypothetical protein AAGJ35_12280, partial [Myxococcota bacterium]
MRDDLLKGILMDGSPGGAGDESIGEGPPELPSRRDYSGDIPVEDEDDDWSVPTFTPNRSLANESRATNTTSSFHLREDELSTIDQVVSTQEHWSNVALQKQDPRDKSQQQSPPQVHFDKPSTSKQQSLLDTLDSDSDWDSLLSS